MPSVPTTSELIAVPKRRSRARLAIASVVVLAAIASAGWFALPDSAASPATAPLPVAVVPPPRPTPPVATPTTPTPTMPAPPTEVAIEFHSTPAGATVRVAGTDQLLGTTPFTYRFKREDAVRRFDFELATYVSATQEIAVTKDGAIAVALSPVPAPVRTISTTQPPTPTVKRHVDRNSTMKVFD